MRYGVPVIVALALTSVLMSCGSSSGTPTVGPGSPATAQDANPAESPAADDTQIADALLTLSNGLPPGWTLTDMQSNASGNTALCGVDLDLMHPTDASGHAFGAFSKGGDLGPYFAEAMVRYNRSEANDLLNRIRQALKTCTQYTETASDGTTSAWKVGELSFPKLGDDSFAFRSTSEGSTLGSAEIDEVLERRGRALLAVAFVSIGFTPPDIDQFVSLAKAADDKMRSHFIR